MKVVILGGGVSGLMAAAIASENHEVVLLEKMPSCGRKLLLTGNGRCNLTNLKSPHDFLTHCNPEAKFLYSALNQFSSQDIWNYFSARHCPLQIEKDDRVFPQSQSAKQVLDVLLKACHHVQIMTNCEVTQVNIKNRKIHSINTKQGEIWGDYFIMAMGGASYPATGSNGDGYKLLQAMGHTITELYPSEVPLVSQDLLIQSKQCQGVTLKNKKVVANQKSVEGDVLITHFGFSGPAILELSEHVTDEIKLVHQPADKPYSNAITMQVPKKYYDWVAQTQPYPNVAFEQQTKQQRIETLNHFQVQTFKIAYPLGLKQAIVTKGGVKLSEIDPKTMRSKLIDNLSICGELLNCHGQVGGYNLTIALSTGYVAGAHSRK